MEIDLFLFLYWAHVLSPIIGFVAYFIVVENVPKHNHFIFAYLVVCFFADGFTYFQMLPAPVVFNAHDICQFIIVMMIYVPLFKQRATIFLATTILLYVIGITATTTVIGISIYQNYMWTLNALLLSSVCLIYLNVVNVRPKEYASSKDLYNTLVMNASFLFYFMAVLLLFLFADWIFKDMSTEMARLTWAYHNAIGLIKNIGLAIAIFLTGRAKQLEIHVN